MSSTAAIRPPLRTHQARSLAALADAWDAGRRRAWVVLPPGAGKTRVGLETITAAHAEGSSTHTVVLAPNTAIQSQWLRGAAEHGLVAGGDRSLDTPVTCLTYQSLAVFDPDAEVADDPDEAGDSELARLHPNGAALVEAMRASPGLLLVLDECHHLLEVWGRLLGELLRELPHARVLGLTATPPDALTGDQAALVEELFGDVVFRAGVPAVVREGHLAPFAELAWLTTPTETEAEWLDEEAGRWRELVAYLSDPAFGSVPFLEWARVRFVEPVPGRLTWAALAAAEPGLSDAALRLCSQGLLELPEGARLLEEHRREPDADDWVALLDDWALTHLARSEDPRDAEVLERIRTALPSVGYVLTRRGVRRGRTPVDRVLARSHAKTLAAADIVAHEHTQLADRTRMLVLCDHERASPTLPTGLQGVIDAQSGSAYATLETLLTDPRTEVLSPLLVTGRTVAGSPLTLTALAAFVGEADPALAGRLEVEGAGPVATLTGPWTSRSWVAPVTAFFEAGHSQVLVGTRGLLGEGWDARRISGLVDLTTATTLTAVVQTRGRALRTDPTWPEKVAVNWSVVCVSEAHPRGGNDWARLVRKHEGFHGVDDDGDIVDGVSHIDPAFSPYAPPAEQHFDELNHRMRVRAADRDAIRARWRIGTPYRDEVAPTLRVLTRDAAGPGGVAEAGTTGVLRVVAERSLLTVGPEGAVLGPDQAPPEGGRTTCAVLAASVAAGAASVAAAPVVGWPAAAGVVVGLAGLGAVPRLRAPHRRALLRWVRETVAAASSGPTPVQVATAVAEALRSCDLVGVGVDGVVVEVHPGGEHRCRLDAPQAEAQLFASALDEALGPVSAPRYLVSRYTLDPATALPPGLRIRTGEDALRAVRALRPDGEVWHQVPSILGVNRGRAERYLAAWRHWVGGGELVASGSPQGAGVLAAQRGADPFAASTVLRLHWL